MKKEDKIRQYIKLHPDLNRKIILDYTFQDNPLNEEYNNKVLGWFIRDANYYISALKRKKIYCILNGKAIEILEVKHNKTDGIHFYTYMFLTEVFEIKKPTHYVSCVSYYANYTLIRELSKIGFIKENKIDELVNGTYGKIK